MSAGCLHLLHRQQKRQVLLLWYPKTILIRLVYSVNAQQSPILDRHQRQTEQSYIESLFAQQNWWRQIL